MNGHWSGWMALNAMSWGLPPPQFHWSASYMLPYHPQMPQANIMNLQVPVPGQGLLPGASFPDPGQPQFLPPRPPSISPGLPSLASFPSQPPFVASIPTKPPSATLFQSGPPTSSAARAPSSASTSAVPSGPPSVASFPKTGNVVPRAWLQPKPKMADALCGDSFAIEEPKRKRQKLGLSRDARELTDEVPVPPAFSLALEQREHAKVQKTVSEVFPVCFPDAPIPEEKHAGMEEKKPFQEPTLPNKFRSAESGDTSLPPPPLTTNLPNSIPTSVRPLTTADPPPTPALSTSKTPKKEKIGKKGANLRKRSKGLVGLVKKEVSKGASVTSGSQSFPSEDQAQVPTTPTTLFLERENVSGAHICPHCGTSYSASAFLEKHVHLCRHRPKEFPCPKCSSSFSQKKDRTTHLETLHRPPKHQCQICGKWFNRKDNCTKHMRTQHSNSNQLKCSICDYSSFQNNRLTAHMFTHSSRKPLSCPLCPASFTENKNLNSHLNKAHSLGQSPLLCPHCGWAFASKARLSGHINSFHKES